MNKTSHGLLVEGVGAAYLTYQETVLMRPNRWVEKDAADRTSHPNVKLLRKEE